MTHDELREAAMRLLDDETGIGNGYGSDYEQCGDAAQDACDLARAYLASGWRTDFDACPTGELVLLAKIADADDVRGIEADEYIVGFIEDHADATHWAEFVPPTTRKEGT